MALANGQISPVLAGATETEINAKIQRLQERLHANRRAAVVLDVEAARAAWASGDLTERRAVLSELIDHIAVADGYQGRGPLELSRVHVVWRGER